MLPNEGLVFKDNKWLTVKTSTYRQMIQVIQELKLACRSDSRIGSSGLYIALAP